MIITADNVKKYRGDYAWVPKMHQTHREYYSEMVVVEKEDFNEKEAFNSYPNCEAECAKKNRLLEMQPVPASAPKKRKERLDSNNIIF